MAKRVVLLVLDGVGVGALPDAAGYGDAQAATLPHVAAAVGGLNLPNLARLGLGHIAAIDGVVAADHPQGCFGRMAEKSPGKDSVTGHWELAGVTLSQPFRTFPDGFPEQMISEFSAVAGCRPLGNIAASGTDILRRLGEEHLQTGRPIVYTSSDSVFQIAAHESVIPPDKLYQLCREAEKILLPYNVCRVIARPFVGESAASFRRTAGRHDFPQAPPEPTLLDRLQSNGVTTCGVGKIHDLFAGRGLDFSWPTSNNQEGMRKTLEALSQVASGLVMTNLVDFDMLYGHRLDAAGFASALEDFDAWLPQLYSHLGEDDLLIISADHGCDPTTAGTDHSREYVPLLVWGRALEHAVDLGSRQTFADVAATVAELFMLPGSAGHSFLAELRG